MGFIIQYKTLFKMSFWHHHWLDSPLPPADGGGDFVPPPSNSTPSDVVERLLDYDLNRLLDLRLSSDSEITARSKGLIFKKTGAGCLLCSKDGYTETDPAAKVVLTLSVRDNQLMTYSDLGFSKFEKKILYLNNFNLAPPALKKANGVAANTLHESGGSGRVEWSPRVVRLPKLNAGTGDAVINVFDLNTSPEQLVLTVTAKSQPGAGTYELDARSLREGLYRFDSTNLANGTVRFLGLENEGGLLAVIELFLKNLNDAQYHIEIDKP